MWLLITYCLGLVISNVCLATSLEQSQNDFLQSEQCLTIGEICRTHSDCCTDADLICYSSQKGKICVPSMINQDLKRSLEDFVIPPYYNPKNQLYPYGVKQPGLPFYKAQESKQSSEGKKLEWDQCRFHEDCGEGNCCHVHFRFRSLPKWFCRPNRNDVDELCEPLTKYRSLKDVPAWKQQQQ